MEKKVDERILQQSSSTIFCSWSRRRRKTHLNFRPLSSPTFCFHFRTLLAILCLSASRHPSSAFSESFSLLRVDSGTRPNRKKTLLKFTKYFYRKISTHFSTNIKLKFTYDWALLGLLHQWALITTHTWRRRHHQPFDSLCGIFSCKFC